MFGIITILYCSYSKKAIEFLARNIRKLVTVKEQWSLLWTSLHLLGGRERKINY